MSDPGTKPETLLYIMYRVTRLCSPPLVPHVAGMSPDKALLLRPLHSHGRLSMCRMSSVETLQARQSLPMIQHLLPLTA